MKRSPFQRFIAELRRRHVPQTAAVYLVAAWAAIQFSDVVVPNLNGPQWIVTAVIVAAGVGFPVVLVLAWLFDWGPEGVVRTDDEADLPDTGRPVAPARSTPWLATAAVLVVGIGSALAVAALLAGDGSDPAVDSGDRSGERSGDRAAQVPPAIAPPPAAVPGSGMPSLDSLTSRLFRDLDESGLEGLARLGEWEALGRLGALGATAGDSAREDMAELARDMALESGQSVFMLEPGNWRLGSKVPHSLAVGDTLLVSGVAVDTVGVVAVMVDGETVVEADEPRPVLSFEARLVGRPAVGLRDVPVVVRTADGRELRTDYSLAVGPEGG